MRLLGVSVLALRGINCIMIMRSFLSKEYLNFPVRNQRRKRCLMVGCRDMLGHHISFQIGIRWLAVNCILSLTFLVSLFISLPLFFVL